MPQAVVAVAGSVIGAGAAAAAGGGLFGAFVGAIVSTGFGVLGQMLFGPDVPDIKGLGRSFTTNVADPGRDIPVVYGLSRIAGTRVFAHTTGDDNKNLYLVFVLSEGGHPDAPSTNMIDDCLTTYFDGIPSGDSRWVGLNVINEHLGADNQTADSMLTSQVGGGTWTTDHRLRGLCYIAVKLVMPDPDPETGNVPWTNLPNIATDVRGRKVYDCRVGAGQSASDPTTWTWSDNPALCLLDYLRDERYGKGIPDAELDFTSFADAADYCDQLVVITGGTQKRYTCNGILSTGVSIIENVRALLSCCRGMLIWQAGKYYLRIDKPEVTSAFDFDQDTIVGGWQISLGARAQRYNRARAHWINPDRAYQEDTAIIRSPSFKVQDKNEDLDLDIQLPFTKNFYTARHLATISLKRSRDLITCSFIATMEALRVVPGSKITITHPSPGWVLKEFRVLSLELMNDGGVRVNAAEYSDSAYELDALNDDDTAGNTNLPNPTRVKAPTNLVLTTGPTVALVLADGTVQARVKVDWDASPDAFTDHYEVQFKISTETAWQSVKTSAAITEYLIPMVQAGSSYDVRVRAVNTFDAKSTWLTGSTTAQGKNAAPGAPSGVTATAKVGAIYLKWTNTTDPDLDSVEIWESATSSFGAATQIASIAASGFMAPVPEGQQRWYWLRSRDTSGNVSGYSPSTAGAGVTATAQSVSPDSVFDLIRDVGTTSWRHTFDDNLWPLEPFVDSAGTVVQEHADYYLGDASGLFTASGGSTGGTGYRNLPSELVGAWSNKRVRVSLWYKAPASNGATQAAVRLYDHVGATFDSGVVTINPTGAWQRVDFIVSIGSAARNGRFLVYADRLGTNKAVLIDGVTVQMVPDVISAANIDDWFANLAIGNAYIANAAIDAAKIASLAVTTAKIQDANVTTLKIGGNSVTLPLAVTVDTYSKTSGIVAGTWYDIPGASVTLPSVTAGTRGSVIAMAGFSSFVRPGVLQAGYFRVLRSGGSVQIGYDVESRSDSSGAGPFYSPPVIGLDAPANSAQTYKLQIKASTNGGSLLIDNATLVVLEAKR